MKNIRAVLFDMDGTLTVPHIDWKRLRARVGVPEGAGIMEHIYALPEADAERADAIVREVEMEAALASVANEGLAELFEGLDQLPLQLALITNNHREAMEHVVTTFGLRFDVMLSREDALLKPAPDLLLLALERLEVAAEETVFVGDGRYDRVASKAAGVAYIHLAHDGEMTDDERVIYGLPELLGALGIESG
jgi:HAD superfamily hydrolase (TIGR01509 family)